MQFGQQLTRLHFVTVADGCDGEGSAANANRIMQRVKMAKRMPSGRAKEDLKIEFEFVGDFDESAGYADGLDCEIGLLENGVGGIGGARPFDVEADGFRDAVQG